MTQGSPGGSIPISQLVSRVEVDLTNSTENLRQHREELRAASDDTKKLGAEAGSGLASGMNAAETSVKKLNETLETERQKLAALKEQLQALGGSGPGTKELDDAITKTTQSVAGLEAQLQKLGNESQTATREAARGFLETVSSVDQLRQHLVELQAVQERGRAQGIFSPGLQQEISQTQSALRSVDGTARDFGATIGDTTGKLLTHILVYQAVSDAIHSVTSAFAAGITSAADYQTSLLKINALTVSGAADVKTYSSAIVALSQGVPASAKELGDALFFIESHGIKGAAAMDSLRTSALASEAGLGKTSDIARVTAAAIEAYGASNLTAAHATDLLTTAVKEGSVAPDELANSLGRTLSIAAAAGVSFEQVLANVATLTREGVPASVALNGLRTALLGLEKPGADAQKALGELGLTAADLRKMVATDLAGTLQMLEQRTGGNVEQIGRLVPEARALVDVLGVTGTQGAAYAEVLDHMYHSQGATAEAAAIMSESLDNQQKVLKNNWDALIIGLDILPKLSAAIKDTSDRIKEETERQGKLREEQVISDAIRDQAGSKTGELTARILADAKQAGLSYIQINAELAKMKVPSEFVAEMDRLAAQAAQLQYLQGRAGSFPEPFGPDMTQGPKVSEMGVNPAPPVDTYDFEAQRRQAQQIAQMGSEARQLRTAAEGLQKVEFPQGLVDPAKVEQAKDKLLTAAAEVEVGWNKALSPAEAQRRGAELDAIVNQIAASVTGATDEQIAALDALTAKYGVQDAAVKKAAADAAEARRQQADAARQLKEAQEADPLLGIQQAMNRDRADLVGTAGTVMADIENAVKLRGQQGAREAGLAFGNEARKWGEELEKAGLPGWEQAFNDLIARGRVAVVTGSPEMLASIHELLAQGEREIKEANIGKAVAEATARANNEMLAQQLRSDNELATAQATAADARATALQGEVDREYQIWASREVDKLTEADKNGRELQRIREGWARQDTDREEQERRARSERDEQSNRAAQDRARQNARTLADLQDNFVRSAGDTQRSRQREDRDAEYEHTQRLKQIQAQGGPDVNKSIAEENASFQQQIADRTRRRGEDDAEAQIKRAQQVADAQKRIAEQTADARIHAGEQASDLARRQTDQDTDRATQRARQLQDRTDQAGDAEWLKTQRITHETQFFTAAEQQAATKFQNDLARIDARYEHEVAKAAAASEQIQLKRQHDIDDAEIRAKAKEGTITQDQATELLGASDQRFTEQSAGISSNLRQRETQIDTNLRGTISGSRQYDPRFTPAGIPFELTPQYQPRQPAFDWKAALGGSADSVLSTVQANAKSMPLQFMGQSSSNAPVPVILPDQQIQDIIDGVGNLPPMEMDGEVVEASTSRIRRNRNLARTVG